MYTDVGGLRVNGLCGRWYWIYARWGKKLKVRSD